MLLYCKFQKDRDYILLFFISCKPPGILPCPCCWMNEGVNKGMNKWKHAQGRYLYSRVRINSFIQSYLFFPTNNISRVSACRFCSCAPHKGAWGLVGLKSAWVLSPGIRLHLPGQKAPVIIYTKAPGVQAEALVSLGLCPAYTQEYCVIYCP